MHIRNCQWRKPLGKRAHQLDSVLLESEAGGDGDRHDHGDQHVRHGWQRSAQDRHHRQGEHADGERGPYRLTVADAVDERAPSSTRPFASVENPNSFGSCPTRIVIASPFM